MISFDLFNLKHSDELEHRGRMAELITRSRRYASYKI